MTGRARGNDPLNRQTAAVMRDVAKLAGVSHQTVSRVLNEHANVRPETRDRVLEAMRRLDYQRNTAARALVTRRSQTLGLVTIDTTLAGPASMVYGIEQAARDAGYFVSIVSVRTLSRSALLGAINRLREQSVEGIIALVPQDGMESAFAKIPPNLPLVAVGVCRSDDVPIPMVGVDNTAGATMAVEHLLSLGHRGIAHISGPGNWPEAREREVGWRTALERAGIPPQRLLVGDWSARSGYEAGLALATDPNLTAVFCANDHTALGLIGALYRFGRRVPQDISVIGFDDIPEAGYFYPPLTTIQQDFAALGRQSFELLIQQIESQTRTNGRLLLTPHLTLRESTSAPPNPPVS